MSMATIIVHNIDYVRYFFTVVFEICNIISHRIIGIVSEVSKTICYCNCHREDDGDGYSHTYCSTSLHWVVASLLNFKNNIMRVEMQLFRLTSAQRSMDVSLRQEQEAKTKNVRPNVASDADYVPMSLDNIPSKLRTSI